MIAKPAPIFITGCARSGTSMVAGVLAALGLDFGRPLHSNRKSYQPRGFFEHRGVRQFVLKPILREIGADPLGQNPLPARGAGPSRRQIQEFRRKYRREIGRGVAYKDAKIILVWRWFHGAFPRATFVLVRRDPKAIARSCLRTPFMKRRRYLAGWLDWVREHEARMEDLKASGANVLEIWPDAADPETFRPLAETLGLIWDEQKVRGALVPEAWHQK